jgi:hypothetical protein
MFDGRSASVAVPAALTPFVGHDRLCSGAVVATLLIGESAEIAGEDPP